MQSNDLTGEEQSQPTTLNTTLYKARRRDTIKPAQRQEHV